MESPRISERSPGLSLIECVMAVAILSSAILAGLELFDAHVDVSDRSTAAVRAVTILGRELEVVRATRYDGLRSRPSYIDSRDPGFTMSRIVTTTATDTREVTVMVTWDDDGQTRSRAGTTYRCKEAP